MGILKIKGQIASWHNSNEDTLTQLAREEVIAAIEHNLDFREAVDEGLEAL